MEPEQAPQETPAETPQAAPEKPRISVVKTKHKRLTGSTTAVIVLVVILLAAGAGAYWHRDKTAKDQQKLQAAAILSLKQQLTDSQKELVTEKAKSTDAAKPVATPAVTSPSAATIQNIKESITSGNTAALQGYMASTVNVIIAASEGIGNRTSAQAVGDVTSYIKNATSPWDFALPSATLAKYKAGSYGQYFPTTAVVGQSANKYVISFSFDSAGKISTVFMAVSADLLTD